jgi:predicted AlkP superfamily phosphohydrolase/phosphomutase
VTQRSVLLVAFDAGNPALVREFVGRGELPNFERVLRHSRSAVVENEAGLFVGAVWPTLLTGLGVDRHGFYTGIRPAPHEYHYIAEGVHGDPLWTDVLRDGKSVVVVDAPMFAATEDADALQIVEWGCHDRYHGTHCWPPELLDEVLTEVGRHPLGMLPGPEHRYAPCDWFERPTTGMRDAGATERFVKVLEDGIDRRRALMSYLRGRGRADLFIDVVGETHCAGHHLWHLHQADHPAHDPALVERLGGDPMLRLYRKLDRYLGDHLDATGDGDTVYVLLSHGMRGHFDGTLLLDEVLWRLEQAYRGERAERVGPLSAGLGRVLKRLPAPLRRSLRRPLGFAVKQRLAGRDIPSSADLRIPDPSQRLWYQLENNTVAGAVRFNRLGREPNGLVGPGIESHATRWLIEQLTGLVNSDTGRPVVDAVYPASDVYRRRDDDGLPDLIIEWNSSAPIDRVWSATIGPVTQPYNGFRSGDHDRFGELFVMEPTGATGSRPVIRAVDVAPTVAAAVGVELADRDGRTRADLVGTEGTALGGAEQRDPRPKAADPMAVDEIVSLRREILDLRVELNGLKRAHHETREIAERRTRGVDESSVASNGAGS